MSQNPITIISSNSNPLPATTPIQSGAANQPRTLCSRVVSVCSCPYSYISHVAHVIYQCFAKIFFCLCPCVTRPTLVPIPANLPLQQQSNVPGNSATILPSSVQSTVVGALPNLTLQPTPPAVVPPVSNNTPTAPQPTPPAVVPPVSDNTPTAPQPTPPAVEPPASNNTSSTSQPAAPQPTPSAVVPSVPENALAAPQPIPQQAVVPQLPDDNTSAAQQPTQPNAAPSPRTVTNSAVEPAVTQQANAVAVQQTPEELAQARAEAWVGTLFDTDPTVLIGRSPLSSSYVKYVYQVVAKRGERTLYLETTDSQGEQGDGSTNPLATLKARVVSMAKADFLAHPDDEPPMRGWLVAMRRHKEVRAGWFGMQRHDDKYALSSRPINWENNAASSSFPELGSPSYMTKRQCATAHRNIFAALPNELQRAIAFYQTGIFRDELSS